MLKTNQEILKAASHRLIQVQEGTILNHLLHRTQKILIPLHLTAVVAVMTKDVSNHAVRITGNSYFGSMSFEERKGCFNASLPFSFMVYFTGNSLFSASKTLKYLYFL